MEVRRCIGRRDCPRIGRLSRGSVIEINPRRAVRPSAPQLMRRAAHPVASRLAGIALRPRLASPQCASQPSMIISRVTALAILFAVLATTSLSFAAGRQARVPTAPRAVDAAAVVQLERVVVTARRLAAEAR